MERTFIKDLKAKIGQEVTLKGWLQTLRDQKSMQFLILRDRTGLVQIATEHGMEIVSCAEEIDLAHYGVRPGKCIDDDYIFAAFGLHVGATKDPGQRAACGCVASRDIGMYDSCLFGCQYCYATSSFDRARANYATHDPLASSLLE